MLATYLSQTQRLLHDSGSTLYPVADLTYYINIARSQLAIEAECVRFNFGFDGLLLTGVFVAGSNLVLNVSDTSGVQATQLFATTLVPPGTTVLSVSGSTITMSAPAVASASGDFGVLNLALSLGFINVFLSEGVTATFGLTPSYLNSAQNRQEVYPLPTNLFLAGGIKNAIAIKSISVNWGGVGGNNQYMLDYMDWTSFQAYLRFYGPTGLQGNPAVWTRYQNSIYIRPVPTQAYPMQWDCICSVVDLVDDTTPEAIPYPFTDAVPFYAAYMALLNGQRAGDAAAMKEQYEEFARRARAFVQRTIIPTMYPWRR